MSGSQQKYDSNELKQRKGNMPITAFSKHDPKNFLESISALVRQTRHIRKDARKSFATPTCSGLIPGIHGVST